MRARKKMERQFWIILYHQSLELIHLIVLAVANSWILCKQDAISNKISPKFKMDRLKFKLEIVEALAASPRTNKNILTDKDNSVVKSHSQKDRSVMIHLLYISCFYIGHSRIKRLDTFIHFRCVDDILRSRKSRLKTKKAVRRHLVKNATNIYAYPKQNMF
ncbi:uncharacterized protein TNCV_124981 [Trichonephila clavipes]|nr:uncharacterized protein TNCV_124981 [Trichonephila clavipes]